MRECLWELLASEAASVNAFRSEIEPFNPRNQWRQTITGHAKGLRSQTDNGSKTWKEGTMSQTVLDRTAEHIAASAAHASRATRAVADAVEDGVGVVGGAAKQGGDAAKEFLNDTTQRIQRNPVLTVATTFAVGFTAGAFIGWMIKRK
jgi:ElaB/YqjD/DUF883 family membrane-anchored ribosome-binding protein